jgi:4-carboxymuconolactone decarboxylase
MRYRLDLPTRERMTDAQRAVHDQILLTRGNDNGPFLAWLLSPKLADSAQALGSVCRYGTSLSLEESELLIMHVASWYDCPAEAQIHGPIALRAGLSAAVLEAIRTGSRRYSTIRGSRCCRWWRESSSARVI